MFKWLRMVYSSALYSNRTKLGVLTRLLERHNYGSLFEQSQKYLNSLGNRPILIKMFSRYSTCRYRNCCRALPSVFLSVQRSLLSHPTISSPNVNIFYQTKPDSDLRHPSPHIFRSGLILLALISRSLGSFG